MVLLLSRFRSENKAGQTMSRPWEFTVSDNCAVRLEWER
jgi:hypothetical protein